jgi:hypothetical protein
VTPTSIRTGRQFDSVATLQSIPTGAITQILPGDANRVAVSVSLDDAAVAGLAGLALDIGVMVGSVIAPLTCLTAGHPVCYLSVDKIGPALFPALVVSHAAVGAINIGITNVRQIQELPK